MSTACVYTCLIGQYEKLNEQPVAAKSNIPFVCLTDDRALTSTTWEIVQIDPLFDTDHVRSQRFAKLIPERYLAQFDRSIYIDNTVLLTDRPEVIFERFLGKSGLAIPTHSYRDTVFDEFVAVMTGNLDEQLRFSEQLTEYETADPGALMEHPYWSAILVRDHRNQKVKTACEEWLNQVLRYSRRDQLSLNYALRKTGCHPLRIEIDNYSSCFHEWPRISDRKLSIRTFQSGVSKFASSLTHEIPSEVGRLTSELAIEKSKLEQVLNSKSWRFTAPLRNLFEPTGAEQLNNQPRINSAVVQGPNGLKLYVDPTDARGAALIEKQGNLNPTTLSIWLQLVGLTNWTHVVDVGANYGEMIVNVPGAKHLAIEPNPHLTPYLRSTVAQSGLDIEVIGAAVSDRPGTMILNIDRNWSGLSTVESQHPEWADHAIEKKHVVALTLGSIIRERCDGPVRLLCKIDVEGHEIYALRGLANILSDLTDFAALVEIMHLSNSDIDWLLSQFELSLYRLLSGTLEKVGPSNAIELQDILKSGDFYKQDVVLRRKLDHPLSG